jgi:hypothetical protein
MKVPPRSRRSAHECDCPFLVHHNPAGSVTLGREPEEGQHPGSDQRQDCRMWAPAQKTSRRERELVNELGGARSRRTWTAFIRTGKILAVPNRRLRLLNSVSLHPPCLVRFAKINITTPKWVPHPLKDRGGFSWPTSFLPLRGTSGSPGSSVCPRFVRKWVFSPVYPPGLRASLRSPFPARPAGLAASQQSKVITETKEQAEASCGTVFRLECLMLRAKWRRFFARVVIASRECC